MKNFFITTMLVFGLVACEETTSTTTEVPTDATGGVSFTGASNNETTTPAETTTEQTGTTTETETGTTPTEVETGTETEVSPVETEVEPEETTEVEEVEGVTLSLIHI